MPFNAQGSLYPVLAVFHILVAVLDREMVVDTEVGPKGQKTTLRGAWIELRRATQAPARTYVSLLKMTRGNMPVLSLPG